MAHDEIRLPAERRTEFGKGAARRIRRADKIPAVMYGHGADPLHITLPGHEAMLALKNPNALLTIAVEGEDRLALAKDVQRDPIKPYIEHIDLVIVRRGEKAVVEVPVHLEGEAAPETVVTVDNSTLLVEADVTDLPESLVVSVEGLEVGSQILAGAVELPAGATLASDAELLVVNVTQQISESELESELADAEAEAGIEHDESEDEAAEGDDTAAGEAEGDAEESSDQE